MDEVIYLCLVLCDEVDSPKPIFQLDDAQRLWFRVILPGVAVTCREAHEAVSKLIFVNEVAKLAAE